MKLFEIGSVLKIEDIELQVIGYIVYSNSNDPGKIWTEYRLMWDEGELWLSWDDEYQEYSISASTTLDDGMIDSKWHKVDAGRQTVLSYAGDVDVDVGESASFVEYEDDSEEEILSLEIWEDGTEISEGSYVDQDEIEFIGVKKVKKNKRAIYWFVTLLVISFLVPSVIELIFDLFDRPPTIQKYVNESSFYEYVTSVTGNEKQKANVYQYNNISDQQMTDIVARNIIEGIEGNTESVTENNQTDSDGSISILTKKEYCLVYYPDEKEKIVYIQVSDRKYNYSSDREPYHARKVTSLWYRQHYYSSAFQSDFGKWKRIPSSYTMYDGPIMQDLGNGYYDMYASSVRNSSIGRRNSDGGGLFGGK